MVSPPPISNIAVSSIILLFSSLSVSTIMPYSVVSDCVLPVTQFWPGIWHWWITGFFRFTMLSILPLSYMLFCVSRIVTGKKTGSSSDILGACLVICGTIISRLNCYPRTPLTKALFLVIIEAWIVHSNGHEKMVLNATLSPRAM